MELNHYEQMPTMCEQIPAPYPDRKEWPAIPAQPILQCPGTITPDSDVEARVTLFMQTTGRGLQGQYWRKSALELSKWLTAQIQYERQGWQLKLQTALKEIEKYRREALMADKVLSDSLELLLQCMNTCTIKYNSKVSSASNKKQLLTEYVEVLSEVFNFLIQERSQCFCLMKVNPDMETNLVECIRHFLDAETQSNKEAKSYTEKQEDLHLVTSNSNNELGSFQKEATYENRIPANYISKQPHSFIIRKYKKRRFGSLSPMFSTIDVSALKNNTICRLKASDCDEEDKAIADIEKKTKSIQQSLKLLKTKEVDINDKFYSARNQINDNETIMKPTEDRPLSVTGGTRTLRSDDSSASDGRTQYNLPPIKGKKIKETQRKMGSAKNQSEFIHTPVPSPPSAEPLTLQPIIIATHLLQQQNQQQPQLQHQQDAGIKQVQKCSHCKCSYKVTENQKLPCCYHPKGKKRADKNVLIWPCCNRSLESGGCTPSFHI